MTYFKMGIISTRNAPGIKSSARDTWKKKAQARKIATKKHSKFTNRSYHVNHTKRVPITISMRADIEPP
jgi:hypothetical protein